MRWCVGVLYKWFTSVQTGSKRRGGAGGLNKVCGVSPELQAVVGEPAMPRTEVVLFSLTNLDPLLISL